LLLFASNSANTKQLPRQMVRTCLHRAERDIVHDVLPQGNYPFWCENRKGAPTSSVFTRCRFHVPRCFEL